MCSGVGVLSAVKIKVPLPTMAKQKNVSVDPSKYPVDHYLNGIGKRQYNNYYKHI